MQNGLKPLLFLFFLLLVLTGCISQARAETLEEKEAREAKAEEEAEEGQEISIKGKVTLNPLDENGKIPVVAGVATVKSGKEYLLKLNDPKNLRAKLVKIGAKEVKLRGYFRNKEKYLILTDVDTDPSTPPPPQEGL